MELDPATPRGMLLRARARGCGRARRSAEGAPCRLSALGAALLAVRAEAACTDLVRWADTGGATCQIHVEKQYCAGGSYGPSWEYYWGTFADYAVDGVSAADACCACGGGRCDDIPDWVDSSGDGCAVYEANEWCTESGSIGPGWVSRWGTFEESAVDGVSAVEACCACGRRGACSSSNTRATDSGGNGCAYYEQYPGHCGCCDTSSFTAAEACCACNPQVVGRAASILSWPQHATALRMRAAGLTGGLLAELVVRCPHLEKLDLSGNNLSGGLPPELGNLSKLELLRLAENSLSGSIPTEFGKLSNLQELDLYSNQLSGPLPPELGKLSSLQELDLEGNQLSGPLPPELGNMSSLNTLYLFSNQLSGPLPPELGKLSSLNALYLYSNQLSGPLPPEFGKLSSLNTLYLDSNQLSGPLPPELGKLSSLQELDLEGNQLSGPLPLELGKLSSLQTLYLYSNQLSGSLPPEFGNISSLQVLSLRDNMLSGPLPLELGKLSSLQDMRLHSNKLSGPLPSELGKLSSLQVLALHSNQLSGPMPPELGNMRTLQHLALYSNKLSGPLPPELGKLSSLQDMRLYSNQLSGPLPPELGKLSSLQVLALYSNKLSGPLPLELGNISSLQDMRLYSNKLSGPLPPELGKLRNLQMLDLDSNQLSGSLPPELGKLSSLESLDLDSNQLSGPLPPDLGNISSLERLDLDYNQLSGSLPPELGNISSLQSLILHSNQLSGSLPPELGKLSSLQDLYLSYNQLSGPLPSEFGNMSSLQVLDLHSNQLSGLLPPELGKLSSLQELDVDDNLLSGPLPPELGNASSLEVLDLDSNQLSGSLPPELGKLSSLQSLNLHSNQLSGSLPPELGKLSSLIVLQLVDNQFSGPLPPELGKLSSLQNLYLSFNQLSGPLPSEFGNMSSLQKLDLRYSQLSGPLPPELGKLSSLQSLDLSSNQLSGPMPPSLGDLISLEVLEIQGNEFVTGSLAFLHGMAELREVNANGCSFGTAASLPPKLKVLQLSANNFTAIPFEWSTQDLPSLQTLRLDRNHISTWELTGVFPDTAFPPDGGLVCGVGVLQQHLSWPQLRHLNISGNPLSIRARDLLHSVAYLPSLLVLDAASCRLHGHIPLQGFYDLALAPAILGNVSCILSESWVINTVRPGFQSLVRLDLSDNSITGLSAPPSESLSIVDLSRNSLSKLSAEWYNEQGKNAVASLDSRGNSELQAPVSMSKGGVCPVAGAHRLLANSLGFAAIPGSSFECTSICPGIHSRVFSDHSISEAVLCRCTHGQGVGTDCTACPNDTFSELQFVNGRYQRVCRGCPQFSEFREHGSAESYRDCQCEVGRYMIDIIGDKDSEASYGECVRCLQWPFRTTKSKGANSPDDCTCSQEFTDLLGSGDQCGCQDGYFMDHANRACTPCCIHEDCTWGARGMQRSLKPPRVKPGFWSLPPGTADEFGRMDFAGHTIWRCSSKDACVGDSECASNRMGQACGLCMPGTYGSSSGPCGACMSSRGTAGALLITALAFSLPAPFFAHLWLDSYEEAAGIALKLRAFQTSACQFLRFLQVLGIVASFRVEWPQDVQAFLSLGASVSIEAPSYLGIACLAEEQSVELELGFRWLAPCGLALVIGASVMLFFPCHSKLQDTFSRVKMLQGVSMRMGPWEGLRVFAWCGNLFYATLLQWGLAVFSCVKSPNGQYSLAQFPQVRCAADDMSWVTLAAIGSLYTVSILALFPLGVYFAWQQAAKCIVKSQSKGWWRFWFEPYRPIAMNWVLSILAFSIALNVSTVVAVGHGTAQLVLAALICTGYSLKAALTLPYYELSNALLDVWYGFAVALICSFGAAAGFQIDPQRDDVSVLVPALEYEKLVKATMVIQWVSLLGPAILMTFQLLTAFNKTKWLIPRRLRPMDHEEHVLTVEEFCCSMDVPGKFQMILMGLDEIEISAFWSVMTYQQPTLGTMDLRSKMSPVARSDSDFLERVSSRVSNRSSLQEQQDIDVRESNKAPPEVRVHVEDKDDGDGAAQLQLPSAEIEDVERRGRGEGQGVRGCLQERLQECLQECLEKHVATEFYGDEVEEVRGCLQECLQEFQERLQSIRARRRPAPPTASADGNSGAGRSNVEL